MVCRQGTAKSRRQTRA